MIARVTVKTIAGRSALARLAIAACLGWTCDPAIRATAADAVAPPDFTAGDPIPAKAPHDWNLGATGARGWMFAEKFATRSARQIRITTVATGSPADGVLREGDVILGVAGRPFTADPRTAFGKALTHAESEAGGGALVLTRWRDGASEEVTLRLPVLGTYAATAPFDCVKSRRILDRGCAVVARRLSDSSYRPHPIVRSLDALALLAGGTEEHLPLVRDEARRAADHAWQGTWDFGYAMLLVAEYALATGDDSVLPGLRRLAVEAARGQSAVGSWGHRFARPDGRLRGYGMMNAPGLPLTIALVMAREAGVDDPEVALAIDRSLKLLRFYAGKGAIPYGDHAPWLQGHEDNGKCGMAAVLFNLTGEPAVAEFFARMSLSAHGGERDCGHTGNYFNMLWAMPGVSLSGPRAAGAWMGEFGGWYYDLARRWDGGFAHQGPPEPRHDSYADWDATGAFLLAYAAPLKRIWLTGRRPATVPQLTAVEAEALIAPGRGWSQGDLTSVYEALSDDDLVTMLGSWSPVLRGRAAAALARRAEPPVARVCALLDGPSLDGRLGACQAIAELGGRSAEAVPALRKTLGADDLWLRVQAAEALAAIGPPAAGAVPDLLEMLARGPTPEDPRGMEQRFIAEAVFGRRAGLLGRALEGVDRRQLQHAVRAGLTNEDGRCRSTIAGIYQRLPFDDIEPLLPAIFAAVVESAPSGEMFADGVRLDGLRVLAAHHVEEGIRACADYLRDQNPWASQKRTPEILAILTSYGAHAAVVLPDLRALAADYADGEPDFPAKLSAEKAAAVRKAIGTIEASTERPELRRLR